VSGLRERYVQVHGWSPSPIIDRGKIIYQKNETTGLGITEQLYTARGTQGSGVGKYLMVEEVNLDIYNYTCVYVFL